MPFWTVPRAKSGRPNTGTVSLTEFELIDRFFSRRRSSSAPGVILGIGDDAALIQIPPLHELVAAVDTIVEGRHFLPSTSPHSIGYRALAVNLSDLAAMGATPAWALLALTLPSVDPDWLEAFAAGWFEVAERHGVELVGGDTTRGPLTISVQLLGHVPAGTALRRAHGRAGDLLVVTGTLGDSGAGLEIARRGGRGSAANPAELELLARFDYPRPRVEFGIAAGGIAHAAMDLSDGLAGDLPKLAAASGLAAHVDMDRLPLSESLLAYATAERAREWAATAGDDYELLLSVAPDRLPSLEAAAGACGVRLTVIGGLRTGQGVTWSIHGRNAVPASRGFDHFR